MFASFELLELFDTGACGPPAMPPVSPARSGGGDIDSGDDSDDDSGGGGDCCCCWSFGNAMLVFPPALLPGMREDCSPDTAMAAAAAATCDMSSAPLLPPPATERGDGDMGGECSGENF